MGTKSRNPKPKWTQGKEIPFFSGKTWAELEDIYPRGKRINNDIWRVIGLMGPAWVLTSAYCKEVVGKKMHFRDFLMLCYMQRVEEARDNVAFDSYHILKGYNIGGRIYTSRKAMLHKMGFIETMPGRLRIYRVTGLGKMIMYNFVQNLEKANDNLLTWVESQPKEHQDKISSILRIYCSDLFLPPPPTSSVGDETVNPD